jgi:hypothetical protein
MIHHVRLVEQHHRTGNWTSPIARSGAAKGKMSRRGVWRSRASARPRSGSSVPSSYQPKSRMNLGIESYDCSMDIVSMFCRESRVRRKASSCRQASCFDAVSHRVNVNHCSSPRRSCVPCSNGIVECTLSFFQVGSPYRSRSPVRRSSFR